MSSFVDSQLQFPCPPGRFGSAEAETSQHCAGPCAGGFECPAGSIAAEAGVCPLGFYCPGQGGPRQPCPAGRFSDQLGTMSAAACVACPAGTYSSMVAATTGETCSLCSPGDSSSPGTVACWPGVVSAAAFNPPPVTPGFSVGDVVVATFSSPTNGSAVASFTPPIGALSSSWRAGGRELWLTVTSTSGVNPSEVDVASGLLSLSVSGVFSADGASPASTGTTLLVGGTWGVPSPPVVIDVTAADSGHNVGPGTNDTLVMVFDQAVRQVVVRSPGLLAALLSFQPPFPASVVATGAWTSPTSLTVLFTVSGDLLPHWTRWNVGTLVVAVRTAANLTSANGESGASNSSAVVRGGSWGDAPGLALSPKNATSAVATLALPATVTGYSVSTFVVQWSTSSSFVGIRAVPDAMAGVQAWALRGQPSAHAVDGSGRVVASVVLLSSGGSGPTHDTAIVNLTIPASSLISPFRIEIPSLTTNVPYFVRGACNGPAGAMGPVLLSDPASITPQPPRILFIVGPSSGLPTPGGIFLEAEGDHLGDFDSTVFLVLSGPEFGPFATTDCAIVEPATRIRCTSPAGVGTGLSVSVSVDGVVSPPFANGTLSYAAPAILGLREVSDGVEDGGDGGVPTSGGRLVVVEGLNFGPAALGARSLGAVSYSPRALSVLLGTQVLFPALDCVITRDHSEVTCGVGPGVGGGLQWNIAIAGQTASIATTTYRLPVITAMGVLSSSGALLLDPTSLRALVTSGGQQLVRLL
jgi:hypothetical protein